MKYRPPNTTRDEITEHSGNMDMEELVAKEGTSDLTAFLRMQTELEPRKNLVDGDFFQRHRSRIIAFDKFAPLSNIADKRLLQIDRMRRKIIDLEEEAGLFDEAETDALDNVADFQISRGFGGFFQKAQITQRHEIREETKQDKSARWGGLFKRKNEEPGQGEDGG